MDSGRESNWIQRSGCALEEQRQKDPDRAVAVTYAAIAGAWELVEAQA